MKQIYIIRHCSAAGQQEEAPLTPEGVRQSQSLSDFLEGNGIEHIVSSPMLRAKSSIEPFAIRNNIEIEVDNRLRERVLSAGNLDNWMECLERTFSDYSLRFDGGETSDEATKRAVEAIEEILSNKYRTTALVTHGNLLALMIRNFDPAFGFENWVKLQNPDVFILTFGNDGGARIRHIWNKV